MSLRIKGLLKPTSDSKINPLFVVLAVTILCFVVIVAWIIKSKIDLANSGLLYINNIDEYAANMPTESRNAIYYALYKRASDSMIDDKKTPNTGAIIRKNEYQQKQIGDTNVYASNFIVDIPEIRQSYRVSLSWADGSNPDLENQYARIYCVDRDKVIYDDFKCDNGDNTVLFPGDEQADLINEYLPYTKYNANGSPLYQVVLYNGWIMVSLQTCGDEELTAQYRKEVDDWLKSTHIDLEKYKDKINYKVTCDGSF